LTAIQRPKATNQFNLTEPIELTVRPFPENSVCSFLKKLAPYLLLAVPIDVMWAQLIEKFNFKV
jgi:hypothetical protein